MKDGMTDLQFNAFLEAIAILIETKATTVEEAAQLVRQAMISEDRLQDEDD